MDENILKYMATKNGVEDLREEFRITHNETLSRLDEIVSIVKRIDHTGYLSRVCKTA